MPTQHTFELIAEQIRRVRRLEGEVASLQTKHLQMQRELESLYRQLEDERDLLQDYHDDLDMQLDQEFNK